mmetsp:Transcript_12798/g.39073  ORF Transcript_12798/g.39073 Transcript_12798/m.39073 type:complete len:205 (+) Transcript_12798:418-1032(+)
MQVVADLLLADAGSMGPGAAEAHRVPVLRPVPRPVDPHPLPPTDDPAQPRASTSRPCASRRARVRSESIAFGGCGGVFARVAASLAVLRSPRAALPADGSRPPRGSAPSLFARPREDILAFSAAPLGGLPSSARSSSISRRARASSSPLARDSCIFWHRAIASPSSFPDAIISFTSANHSRDSRSRSRVSTSSRVSASICSRMS